MFVTIALDLAWSGPTGVAVFTVDHGGDGKARASMRILRPFRPPSKRRGESDGEHHARVAQALAEWVRALAQEHRPNLLAVEVSDWHQPADDKRSVGRERKVQRALGRAEGVLALTVAQLRVEFPDLVYVEMGVTQVKEAIAKSPNAGKAKVACCVRLLYPNLPVPRSKQPLDGYDAAALAHVATAQYAMERRCRDTVRGE